MTRVNERPFCQGFLNSLQDCITEAKNTLGPHYSTASPLEIVEGIQDYLGRWHRENPNYQKDFEIVKRTHMIFGSLWGEQLVLQFGWVWSQIYYHDRSFSFGVVSPDRSLVTYPFECIEKMLESPLTKIDLTKSFRMLIAGQAPASKPKSYTTIELDEHTFVEQWTNA